VSVVKTAVVGGGPAGCAAAYFLRRQGHEVALFETQDHVGGRTSQAAREGFDFGSGALFLMGGIYPRTNALLEELGHTGDLVPWDAKTQVLDDDGQRYRAKFDQVVSFLGMPVLSWRDKLRVAVGVAKTFLSPGPTSCFDGAELAKWDSGDLESWSRRVLGDRGTRYITEPYMGFLYAVPLSWLSPALFHAVIKQFHKLSLSVPPGGAGQITQWIVEATPGLELHLSTAVDKVAARPDGGYQLQAGGTSHDVDAIVMAPEPGVAADLLEGIAPDQSVQTLRDCPYSDYAHVQVGYHVNPWPKFAASVALPATTPRAWGACVLQSHRHPASIPPGGEGVGVYFYTPPLADMTDDEIVEEALAAISEVYGPAPRPDVIELFHYQRGLSIATPGHYARMDALHAQMPEGVYLAGDYFAHAGIEAAILSGERAAQNALAAHRVG
jgi:protoporphyrinogen/coproporphyrinogen III oxidase